MPLVGLGIVRSVASELCTNAGIPALSDYIPAGAVLSWAPYMINIQKP
jgi:hypothetical protein